MNPVKYFDSFGQFLVLTIVAIMVVVGLLSNGIFLDSYNLQSMGFQMPEIALLSVAMMLAMLSGNSGIDLSLIGIANLSSIAGGLLAATLVADQTSGNFAVVFILLTLAVGALCGLFNGFLIAVGGYTPILATLGTQLLFLGFAVSLTDGAAILFKYSEAFSWIGNSLAFGVPVSLWIFMFIAIGVGAALQLTAFGKRLVLMGTNTLAARYAGFNNVAITISVYAFGGLLASLAGVLMASRASSVKWDYGNSYILIAILTVVMAGVSPSGGRGRIVNVVLASIALQLLSSAFSILGMSSFLKDFTWGALLILSVMATQPAFLVRSMSSSFARQAEPTNVVKGGATPPNN
jgi:simple sugar transport system permease protein